MVSLESTEYKTVAWGGSYVHADPLITTYNPFHHPRSPIIKDESFIQN